MIATSGCFRGGSAMVPPASVSSVDDRALADRLIGRSTSDRASMTGAIPLDPASDDSPLRTPATLVSLPSGLQPNAAPRHWKYIVLHHTATESGDVATIDEEHRQRKDTLGNPWLGIGYHFVVGNGDGMADGLVEPTFRWRQQIHGAHAGNKAYNEAGIGICLVGNFVEGHPTPRQVAATRNLVALLCKTFDILPAEIVRHEDITATDCPGKNFPFEEIVGHSPAIGAKPIAIGGQPVEEFVR